MLLRNLVCFVLLLGAPLSATPVSAPGNTLVGDTFTLDSGKRLPGKGLGHLPSEIGHATWIATDHLRFTDHGTVTSNTVNPVVGSLPLPTFSKTLTVQADFKLEGSAYVALAFADQGDPNRFWDSVKILATLTKSGHFVVYANGVKIKLADGNLKTALPSVQTSHLELSYDPHANTASFTINGEKAADHISLISYAPTITYACFRFQDPVIVNTPEVGNFFVSEK